jgi:hypothetical protein
MAVSEKLCQGHRVIPQILIGAIGFMDERPVAKATRIEARDS